MSTSTDVGYHGWMAWTDNGTQVTWHTNVEPWPVIRETDLLVVELGLSKPHTKNKNVEKKIKRRGWSKQFYERSEP